MKARRPSVRRRINQIVTKYMTGNNSNARLLTVFALTRGRGNDPFTARAQPLRLSGYRHPGNAKGVIYRLASQAVCAWRQGSSERSMALSVTMSLRMTAVITTLAHFPFRLSRSAKLFMMRLCRVAVSAAM
jgi:hypothetical protein